MKHTTFFILLVVMTLLLPPMTASGEGAPPRLSGGSLAASNASFVSEPPIGGWVSVAIVGDVNGDGYADMLIGSEQVNSDQGRAYLFLGGPSGW